MLDLHEQWCCFTCDRKWNMPTVQARDLSEDVNIRLNMTSKQENRSIAQRGINLVEQYVPTIELKLLDQSCRKGGHLL